VPRRIPPAPRLERAPTPTDDPADAARQLLAAARDLGFDPVGIAPPVVPEEAPRLSDWLAAGRQGGMAYMARDPGGRADAGTLLEGARAVLMVALPYAPERAARPDPAPPTERGYVATYAQAGFDYHRVLAGRLELLAEFFRALQPGARARRFCDTAPLLERAFARAAGLGFVAKNTCLIDPRRGSFLFLGGLVVDRPLPPDGDDVAGSCGTCTRCLEACPTDAFPAPFVLDARRCISYLTIEHRGAWPADEDLRREAGTHVFGCDVCQTVCPWNLKFAPAADPDLAPDPERRAPVLTALYERAARGFKSLARDTPWERAGKRGFLRNVATAMGNAGDPRHRPALEALAEHDDPAVRDHARWALGRLGG